VEKVEKLEVSIGRLEKLDVSIGKIGIS